MSVKRTCRTFRAERTGLVYLTWTTLFVSAGIRPGGRGNNHVARLPRRAPNRDHPVTSGDQTVLIFVSLLTMSIRLQNRRSNIHRMLEDVFCRWVPVSSINDQGTVFSRKRLGGA